MYSLAKVLAENSAVVLASVSAKASAWAICGLIATVTPSPAPALLFDILVIFASDYVAAAGIELVQSVSSDRKNKRGVLEGALKEVSEFFTNVSSQQNGISISI